jgi:hypothetical protein
MVNQQFRRDYWVKGERKVSAIEQSELIQQHKLVLTSFSEDISLKLSSSIGEVNLNEAIYSPIIELMSDHNIRSFKEIASKLKDKSISFPQVVQAAMVLVGSGHMASVQSEEQTKAAKETSAKLNHSLMDKARFSADVSFLASPVTGGGIVVNRIQQLFLLAIRNGKKQPENWANDVWSVLSAQNQRLLKEGKTLESAEDSLKELVYQANKFAKDKLHILKSLGIV